MKLDKKGVAIVEMAIVMPLLFLFVFASIDFVRYLQTKTTLDKATELSASMAKKLPLLDRNPSSLFSKESKQIFSDSINSAISVGNNFASLAFASDDKDGISLYHRLNQSIDFATGDSYSIDDSIVGVILPCQSAYFINPKTGQVDSYNHHLQTPTSLFDTSVGCNQADDNDIFNDDYITSLKNDYIITVARVEFNFMTPLIDTFGPQIITSIAKVRREVPQIGKVAGETPVELVYTPPTYIKIEPIDPIVVDPDTGNTGGGGGGGSGGGGTSTSGNGGSGVGGSYTGTLTGTSGGSGSSGGPAGGGSTGGFATD